MMVRPSTAIDPQETDTGHLIQVFDSEESLGNGVAWFFRLRNDQMLCVASEDRWYSIARCLSALGQPADGALHFGRLIVRDAKDTFGKFSRDGTINPGLFRATVGTLAAGMSAEYPGSISAIRATVKICAGSVVRTTACGPVRRMSSGRNLVNRYHVA